MKHHHYLLLASSLLTCPLANAQTAPTSGTITYETMRRIDPSNIRINVNGQEIRPGGTLPDGRKFEVPETTEGVEKVEFGGQWAKADNGGRNQMRMFRGGPGGGFPGGGDRPGGDRPDGNNGGGERTPEQMRAMQQRMNRFRMPMEQATHTDLTTGKSFQLTTLNIDSTKKEYYQTEVTAARPADWKVTGKTKTILGYTCQRATCTIKEQPCSVWFTTDLPFTYSPAPNFTPDKGVVLFIESDDLMYRATKIDAGAVNEALLKPRADAKTVSADELRTIRQKAMATLRQQQSRDFPIRN
ncbi:GLPGLI family protein [Fibrella sp. HMF5335]|uniref:GLPGLI family protein n=1 Tax=Fibrella rubiginis TaxID=2817060 RepID=A0A939K787_9BACT|nr:GLPGLI family protein [Fibrella rubiginis]MBO0938365.1 GLPGLI family protein [Fibrella rubiginis]